MQMASGGMTTKTLTVTVDQSNITDALQVAQFFADKLGNPAALMSIFLLDEKTVEDEFISLEYNFDGLFKTRQYRWKNNTQNNFSWAVQNYSCNLVVGKRYECTFIS